MNRWPDAPCIDRTDVFYSLSESRQDLAISLCQACPHQTQCRAEAEERGEEYGVWGGKSFDRKNRFKSRKRPKQGVCVICGGAYETKHSRQQTCSAECQSTRIKERHSGYRKKAKEAA